MVKRCCIIQWPPSVSYWQPSSSGRVGAGSGTRSLEWWAAGSATLSTSYRQTICCPTCTMHVGHGAFCVISPIDAKAQYLALSPRRCILMYDDVVTCNRVRWFLQQPLFSLYQFLEYIFLVLHLYVNFLIHYLLRDIIIRSCITLWRLSNWWTRLSCTRLYPDSEMLCSMVCCDMLTGSWDPRERVKRAGGEVSSDGMWRRSRPVSWPHGTVQDRRQGAGHQLPVHGWLRRPWLSQRWNSFTACYTEGEYDSDLLHSLEDLMTVATVQQLVPCSVFWSTSPVRCHNN